MTRKKVVQTTVFDARVRKSYLANIINIAVESDFNRIDATGFAPDAFEIALGMFENDLRPALDRTIEAGKFQNSDDRAVILNFICLVALRNPRFREIFRSFHERISKTILDMALATPERWASQIDRARKGGFLLEADAPYDELRRLVDEDALSFKTTTTFHTQLEMKSFDKVLETFFARRWVVLQASTVSGGFITADHPICLLWSDERRDYRPAGFGLKKTEVIFPLSKRLALIGAFEIDEGELPANELLVANINGAVAANAEWQVYARDAGFSFVSVPGTLPRKASRLLDDTIFRRPRHQADEQDAGD